MDLNILRIDVDRSNRIKNTSNLSLNQCSDNNQVRLYYEGDYDYIEMSFRKPDGWLSDKVTLTFDIDEEGYKYAYYRIDQEFTSFIMGGRNAILSANIYFHYTSGSTNYTSTVGNIRINVNYVDDSIVHTIYSEAYMNNINAQIGALQNDFNQFKTGDILVGKAQADRLGNVIDVYYETKSDAEIKFNTLNQNKLDRSEVQDQTQRLDLLETGLDSSNLKVQSLEESINDTVELSNINKEDIKNLKLTAIVESEFEKALEERKEAENRLQSQIDDLASSSNVRDIVASYTDLGKYDKTKLEPGDRIQVLSDAFYGGVPTVYRWTGEEFEFIGKYNTASYTKAEIDSQHNTITNSIPNRATLANGELKLSKGSTPISTEQVKVKSVNGESIWGEGNITFAVDTEEFSTTSLNPVANKLVTEALLNKAEKSSVISINETLENKADRVELEAKQNKLTAGPNVTIVETEDGTIISVDSAIKLKKVKGELDDIPMEERYTNVIYLYKPENEETYSEFLWDADEERWEPFGEAGLHLENYFTKIETLNKLAEKADKVQVEALDSRIAKNTADIILKADKTTTNTAITEIRTSVLNLNDAVANKISKSEFTETVSGLASKTDVPDAYQTKLVSGQNIRTINGHSLLTAGDLVISDAVITDLGLYLTKSDAQTLLDSKANKNELFDRDYNKLKNLPDLTVYRLASDSYSKEEVDSAISAADISGKLTDYYTKTEVESKIAAIDVSDQLKTYATINYVDNAIASVDVSDQLRSYATQVWVSQQGYLKNTEAAQIYATINQLPTVPKNITAFNNDANYLTEATLPTNISFFTNDRGYLLPSDITTKQDRLVSGSNIKTINGESLLGTGNLNVITDISGKQDKLVSGTNIKTINGETLLGSGNIKIITDVSHLETKTDASQKLLDAKDYTDRTNATVLTNAKAYTDAELKKILEGDLDEVLDSIEEIKNQIGGEGVNILASISQNTTKINTVQTDLNNEIETRAKEDERVQKLVETAVSRVSEVSAALESEISNRELQDKDLLDKITDLTDTVNTNKRTVNESLVALNNKLTAEEATRKAEDDNIYSVINTFTENVDTKVVNLQSSLTSTTTSLQAAQKDINDHKTAADTRFASIEATIGTKILFKNWVTT